MRTDTRVRLSKKTVDALKPGEIITDSEIPGFRARCLPNTGTVAFTYRYSLPGKPRQEMRLGRHGEVTVEEARKSALDAAAKARRNEDPLAEMKLATARTENTVDHVLDQWLEVYVRGRKKLRSGDEIERIFARHVRPHIGKVALYDLTRRQVTDMLAAIEKRGPIIAKRSLTHLTTALNWWRKQDDQFVTTPIVKGMLSEIKENPRNRALADDELRDLWRALDELGDATAYPAFVRLLLLFACRRDEVADMHTREFGRDELGEYWKIPASRYKTKLDHVMPLIPAVKAWLPERADGFVLSNDGGASPINGYNNPKRRLDAKIDEIRQREGRGPMAPWQLRDLRRTARTRMTPAGVSRDIAERMLGHKIMGVERHYDCWAYRAEKIDAMERWAAYLRRIVTPPPDNVVGIPGRGHATRRGARAARAGGPGSAVDRRL